jgi:hypothetical protein
MKTDYRLGYGSFDFLPYDNPLVMDSCARFSLWSRLFLGNLTRDQVVQRGPVVYRARSTRQTPHFPFFSLPLEIRYKIYRLLLEPMFLGGHGDLHPNAVRSGARFVVKNMDFEREDGTEVQWDIEVPCRPRDKAAAMENVDHLTDDLGHLTDDLTDASDEESVSSGGEEEMQVGAADEEVHHGLYGSLVPNNGQSFVEVSIARLIDPRYVCMQQNSDLATARFVPYLDSKHSTPDFENCGCHYRTNPDYESVRILSQISKQFTGEAATVLWLDATVEFEEPDAFFLFFKERPAVIPLVNHVVLHLHCYGGWADDSTPLIKSICEFISARMDLRLLTVRLHTELSDQNQIVVHNYRTSLEYEPTKQKLTVEWPEIMRQVKVRGFDFLLAHACLIQNNVAGLGRMSQQLSSLWMPDCLRGSKEYEEENASHQLG